MKLRIGASVRYIEQFERLSRHHARTQGYDGVVCGHHSPRQLRPHRGHAVRQHRRLGGILFRPRRDSAGELQLLRWPHAARPRRAPPSPWWPTLRDDCARSDAWAPQTNGVVTTLKCTAETLTALGHECA